MTRFILPSLLAFAAVSMAHAEDIKILKIDPHSHADRVQLVAAAEQLCRRARLHDLFGDFGTQEECVANTLEAVHPAQVSEVAENRAIVPSRISSAK
jgi:hypothetical protein